MAFDTIKTSLMQGPALGIPDATKPFILFVAESKRVAAGGLTQTLGSWECPVAYFSKQFDPVAQGWPACLRAAAAIILLLEAVEQLTFGPPLSLRLLIPSRSC